MRKPHSRGKLRTQFLGVGKYGIPRLRYDMLATELPSRFKIHRADREKRNGNEALCFFTHDYRFECAWSYPERLVQALRDRDWQVVCEPDFSMFTDRPLAEQIHNVYRARWCGRMLQDAGFYVIPCPNWSFPESYSFAWDGIPFQPPLVAVESQTVGKDKLPWIDGFQAMLDRVQPQRVAVYGERFKIPGVDSSLITWFKPRRYRGQKAST